MIGNNYSIIFKLKASHSYFDKQTCSCVQFLPSEATKLIQKRFDILIDSVVGGVGVYSATNIPLKDFFSYVTKTTGTDYFDFNITTNNYFFWTITQLPENWLGQLSFNSKMSTKIESESSFVLQQTLSDIKNQSKAGTVKIYFDDILKAKEKNMLFRIAFEARVTQWNYYVINKSKMKLENPFIKEKSNSLSLEGPENVKTPNGLSALKFSSGKQLLPLSQIPQYKFDLVDDPGKDRGSGLKPIFTGLPTPDPQKTDIVQISGKNEFSSPMYIYI